MRTTTYKAEIYLRKLSKSSNKAPIRLRITKDRRSMYRLVSFQKSGKPYLQPICERCQEYLIDTIKLECADVKSLSIANVKEEDFEPCIEMIAKAYSLEKREIRDQSIKYSYKIIGKYKDELFINYYNNGRLLIQGRVTPLMLDLTVQYMPLLDRSGSLNNLETILSITRNKEAKIIESDLKKHIIQNYHLIENSKLETALNTSILLVNNAIIDLPDYSSFCFSALKALEGIMHKRIVEEAGSDYKDFGEYFKEEDRTGIYKIREEKKYLFKQPLTCECLEKTYSYFNKVRHPLFHMDKSVETSRTIEYDESVTIINECLKLINNLCRNWD